MTADLEKQTRQEHDLQYTEAGSGWPTIIAALAHSVTPTYVEGERLAKATADRLRELGPVSQLDVHKVLAAMADVHLTELVEEIVPDWETKRALHRKGQAWRLVAGQ